MHRDLSLLIVSDIHDVNDIYGLCFVNNCRVTRCPETFCIITKFGKENMNFVTMNTLIYHGLELKWALAHVTPKELDSGVNIVLLWIPVFKKNVIKWK